MAIEVKKPYREELVKEIKEVGQELINRAEEFVPEDLKCISGFSIRINFPQGECSPIPEISCEYGTFCTYTLDRYYDED